MHTCEAQIYLHKVKEHCTLVALQCVKNLIMRPSICVPHTRPFGYCLSRQRLLPVCDHTWREALERPVGCSYHQSGRVPLCCAVVFHHCFCTLQGLSVSLSVHPSQTVTSSHSARGCMWPILSAFMMWQYLNPVAAALK